MAASAERKRPVALLLYYRSKQAIAKAAARDGPGPTGFPINLVPFINLVPYVCFQVE